MPEIEPAKRLSGGRVVARFHTAPSEIFSTGTPFHPAPPLAGTWAKPLLFVVALAVGLVLAFGQDYLPGWPFWLTWILPGIVLGLFLSTLFWTLMGNRSQREMAVLARREQTYDVTVTCHADGLSWASDEVVHYLTYRTIDQVVEQTGMVLMRHKLFVLYVPARGFAAPEDKAHLIAALRAHLAPEKLAGLAATA